MKTQKKKLGTKRVDSRVMTFMFGNSMTCCYVQVAMPNWQAATNQVGT